MCLGRGLGLVFLPGVDHAVGRNDDYSCRAAGGKDWGLVAEATLLPTAQDGDAEKPCNPEGTRQSYSEPGQVF